MGHPDSPGVHIRIVLGEETNRLPNMPSFFEIGGPRPFCAWIGQVTCFHD